MHGQIMNGSDSVVVFGIINITKCFKYMNSCPGLWHALEQWDNLHYHNVLLELFFFFEYTTICKTKGHTWLYWWDLTENNYLCDEINELDWGGGDMKGMKMKVQPFTSGAERRLSTYKEFRWNAFWKTIREKKPWDPYQLIATVLLNEVDFVLHESMRNMMARDSFLHLRLSLLINAL